ncbi:MAG: hypothetical protein Q4D98_01415 [Planctomycetia bacterium]|nr:hypothetical protein [Planctomycetia bacterium]
MYAQNGMTTEEFARRLERLESENASLKQQITDEKEVSAPTPSDLDDFMYVLESPSVGNSVQDSVVFHFDPLPEASRQASGDRILNAIHDDVEAELARYKNWTWNKDSFTFTPYAWFFLTGVYESNWTVPGEYPFYVRPQFKGDEVSHTWFDMKATRIGAIVTAPESGALPGWRLGGGFEADFQGKYVQENEADFEMRKAYLDLKSDRWYFQFGQSWELVSLVFPPMLNWGFGAGSGNPGYRRPGFRMDRIFTLENGQFTIQTGVYSANTSNFTSLYNGTYTGKMGRTPDIQVRFERTWKEFGFWKDAMFAFGMRYGEKEFQQAEDRFSRDSWMFCLEGRIRFTDRMYLIGEWFTGSVIGNLAGAVFQDLNSETLEEVHASGGWLAMVYDLTPKTHLVCGYSCDDPWNKDVCKGMRSFAYVGFANISYDVTQKLNMGIEYGYYATDYHDLGFAKSNHVTFALNYRL